MCLWFSLEASSNTELTVHDLDKLESVLLLKYRRRHGMFPLCAPTKQDILSVPGREREHEQCKDINTKPSVSY